MLKKLVFGSVGLALLATPLLTSALTAQEESDLKACSVSSATMSDSQKQDCVIKLGPIVAQLATMVTALVSTSQTGQGTTANTSNSAGTTAATTGTSASASQTSTNTTTTVGDTTFQFSRNPTTLSQGGGYDRFVEHCGR